MQRFCEIQHIRKTFIVDISKSSHANIDGTVVSVKYNQKVKNKEHCVKPE